VPPREMRFEVYSNGRYGERERGKDPSPQHSGVQVIVWCRHHGVKTKVRRPKRFHRGAVLSNASGHSSNTHW